MSSSLVTFPHSGATDDANGESLALYPMTLQGPNLAGKNDEQITLLRPHDAGRGFCLDRESGHRSGASVVAARRQKEKTATRPLPSGSDLSLVSRDREQRADLETTWENPAYYHSKVSEVLNQAEIVWDMALNQTCAGVQFLGIWSGTIHV